VDLTEDLSRTPKSGSGVAATAEKAGAVKMYTADPQSPNVVEVSVEKIQSGINDEVLKWQPVPNATASLKRQTSIGGNLVGSSSATWLGAVKLPEKAGNATIAGRYRIVIREYEQYVNGRRLVYVDAIPVKSQH